MYYVLISECGDVPITIKMDNITQVLDLISLLNLSQNSDIDITLSYRKEKI